MKLILEPLFTLLFKLLVMTPILIIATIACLIMHVLLIIFTMFWDFKLYDIYKFEPESSHTCYKTIYHYIWYPLFKRTGYDNSYSNYK